MQSAVKLPTLRTYRPSVVTAVSAVSRLCVFIRTIIQQQMKQESVRPRWPYDMRPSVRAEKYMCVIVIR